MQVHWSLPSIAQQQLVEIVKAVRKQSKIIVMDEPTSSLSENEVDMLFRIIRNLTEQGTSIIYISHKLKELFRITDRITILRDGEHVDTVNTTEVTNDELIEKMVGRKLHNYYVRDEFEKEDVVLKIEHLSKKVFLKI